MTVLAGRRWKAKSGRNLPDPMPLLEQAILFSLTLWSAFYLVNHADLTAKVRNAVFPVLPRWLAYPLQCAFCSTVWVLVAISLFTGFTPLLLWSPPLTLGLDLAYRRLSNTPVAAGPATPGPGQGGQS